MADRSTQLLLDALSRAVADPAGLPLYASKSGPGLFPATAAARQTAERCKDEELVRVVRTETRGKVAQEVCAITDKGLAYLLTQASPRQVLEDLVRAVEAREGQLAELVAAVRAIVENLQALKGLAATALRHVAPHANGAATLAESKPWEEAALAHLAGRAGAAQDCPLPELYQAAQQVSPGLSVGRFHDGLRRLHEQGRIYLHPWTGPLYDLPQPPLALLIGHEVAYYASPRE
ncbi:MAG: hypothetical protein L0Z62_34155 [Gemmataceae bacterium]|nr:hypothetical protein [Gemmataceae bacterium]